MAQPTSLYSDMNNGITRTEKSPTYLYNEDSVHQAVTNLLNTRTTERLMRPGFGNNVDNSLFDIITPATGEVLLNRILEMFAVYEPRVLIDIGSTEITPDTINNMYKLKLTYSIKGIPNASFTKTGNISI